MGKIQLLDCTLRDGGYVNDWNFGRKNLISVFERLVDSGTEIIEVGFLDERRPFDEDRSIMPNTKCVDQIFGGLDKKQAMLLGMIDYGTCGIENIAPCQDCCLDGIRVIFKKHIMEPAMEFCRQLKELGYQVFAQLVSITSYTDEELMKIIGLVNDVKPYAVSIVDTYGLLHPDELLHYYELLNEYVVPEVGIGFHAHNNFQMAYANGLTFLSQPSCHDVVVDGTLYGMGKSAGNAPLELLAMRLNDKFDKHYRIDSMLESIEESILPIHAKSPWGYKEFFYLCAANRCHPNYVTYFKKKENLSVSGLFSLLGEIEPEDKKLLYDKKVAEELYQSKLSGQWSDDGNKADLREELNRRKVLLVGPGRNILLQSEKTNQFIAGERPYVISINYIPDELMVDCVFVTNPKRYHDMILKLHDPRYQHIRLLATSNVECRNGTFDFVVNRAPLLEINEWITDNSFLMALKLLRSIGVDTVYCAGFDGYSDKEDNYCNPIMEYSFVKKEAAHLNTDIKEKVRELRRSLDIRFITYSAYDVEEDINGASI